MHINTYEAARRGKALVIGVDIGYGSVESAKKNNDEFDNVVIIQASLLNLPFKNNVIDAAFSNGVLMHTGNAKKAFYAIARTVRKEGVFVAHLYHKLNPVWEVNDYLLRLITTKLSVKSNMRLAVILSRIGSVLYLNKIVFQFVNLFVRIQPTVHHMFDWYSAPIATHHNYIEVAKWFEYCGFQLLDKLPRIGVIRRPWALNLKGRKKLG